MTGNSFFSVEKIAGGRSGGTTQAETRVYNERLIVSLVRRHGQLAKTDLTRLTGLAAQTITTIVNRAAESELLLRREPLRGRLGQPSVPYSLNPAAAYSFGLKIDHRSADVALVNFVGDVLAFEQTTFDYPTPDDVMAFAKAAIVAHVPQAQVDPARSASPASASPRPSTNGIGTRRSGRRPARLDAWKEIDIRAELDQAFDWPVFLLQRRDGFGERRADVRRGAGLRRLPLCLCRPLYRRRPGARSPSLSRPQQACRRDRRHSAFPPPGGRNDRARRR